jgi:DNA-binding XRE family transcriptional regulator
MSWRLRRRIFMENSIVEVTQANFKEMRNNYGFTLKDVAEEARLSETTILNYENSKNRYTDTCARKETSLMANRALKHLIDHKIANLFLGTEKKKESTRGGKPCLNAVRKSIVRAVVQSYCRANDISMTEFADMCGVSKSCFGDLKNHPYCYPQTIRKICEATGWSPDVFKTDIPTEIFTSDKSAKTFENAPLTEKHNYRLYFENGKYYEEYDCTVVQHQKKELTKEQFIAAAEKEGK